MFVRQPRIDVIGISSAFFKIVLAALLWCPMPATANDTPFLFAGTSIGLDVISPHDGKTIFDIYTGGELSIGRRGKVGEEGYYSFISRLRAAIHSNLLLSDQEYIDLTVSFGRNVFEAALLTSLIDNGSGSTYFNPSWKMASRIASFPNSSTVTLEYAGYIVRMPDEPEDHFHQGIHAVYRIDPSITLGYELMAGGSWQYYPEQPVYEQTGEAGATDRHDLVLNIMGTIDGFPGYFTEWGTSGAVSWRISNATLPVSPDFFLERSEDRFVAAIDTTVFTSPHRSWTIEGALSAEGTRYLCRPARNIDGLYRNEKLLYLAIGASAHAEWSPDLKAYLSLDVAFGYSLSNDPFLGGWYAKGVLALTL